MCTVWERVTAPRAASAVTVCAPGPGLLTTADQLLQSPLSSVTPTLPPSKVTVTLVTRPESGSLTVPAIALPEIVKGTPMYRGVPGRGADMPGDTTTLTPPGPPVPPFLMGCSRW